MSRGAFAVAVLIVGIAAGAGAGYWYAMRGTTEARQVSGPEASKSGGRKS